MRIFENLALKAPTRQVRRFVSRLAKTESASLPAPRRVWRIETETSEEAQVDFC
jgi:hypothetical protein